MSLSEDRAGALGEIAWDVLDRLIRDRLGRKAGGHLVEGTLDRVVLSLPLTLRGRGAGPEAFSRALIDVEPELRAVLKAEGMLTRDSREKERRKYGLKKARKAPQYSKW